MRILYLIPSLGFSGGSRQLELLVAGLHQAGIVVNPHPDRVRSAVVGRPITEPADEPKKAHPQVP